MLTKILIFYQLVVFISFITYIRAKFGPLASISESYYHMKEGGRLWFTLFCYSMGLPMFIIYPSALFQICAAAMCTIGTTGAYREAQAGVIHVVCVWISIISAMAGLWVYLHEGYLTFAAVAALLWIFLLTPSSGRRRSWYAEIAIFGIIEYGLVFYFIVL